MIVRHPSSFQSGAIGGRVVLALLAAVSVFGLGSPAFARMELQVDLGYGNTWAAGAWTPVRLILENLPEKNRPEKEFRDFRGHIEIRASDYQGSSILYREEIELPRQSRKRLEREVMLSPSSPLVVELVDDKGSTWIRKEITTPWSSSSFPTLRHSIYIVPTMLVLTSPSEAFGLPQTLEPDALNIKPVSAEDLPSEYRGYDVVRVLVVRGHLTDRLKPEQLAAMDRWIELGGRLLVITPRFHREISTDPWLAERLPATPSGVMELTMKDVDPAAEPLPVSFTRWNSTPVPNDVLWDSPAGPVVMVARRGAGGVYAMGVDPSAFGPQELETPVGRKAQAFLEYLVLGPGREDLRARHLWSTANIDPDFKNVMLLPNLWVVTALIALFVAVVGPLNFLLLRQRRRLELAWVTIPVLSIIFFVAVYAYGAAAKGGDQHFASTDILHLSPDSSSALLLSSQIQFSPRRDTYVLTPPEGGIVTPLLQYYDDPGNPNAFGLMGGLNVRTVGSTTANIGPLPTVLFDPSGTDRLECPVEQWKMQFYEAESPLRIEGNVSGEVVLEEGQRVTLRLHNNSQLDLTRAVLSLGDSVYAVGAIPAGTAIDTTITRTGSTVNSLGTGFPVKTTGGSFETSADADLRKGAFVGYPHYPRQNPQRRARLVAAISEWNNPIKVEPAPDARKTYALAEISLPVIWAGTRVLSSKEMLRREVYGVDSINTQLSDPTDSQLCRLRDSSIEILIGRAWEGPPAEFEGGTLFLEFRLHTEELTALVYDYRQGAWTRLYESSRHPNLSRGTDLHEEFPIDPAWVNPIDPLIRLRFVASPQSPSAQGQGQGNIFSANYGVDVVTADAVMSLHQDAPRVRIARAGSPVRTSGSQNN